MNRADLAKLEAAATPGPWVLGDVFRRAGVMLQFGEGRCALCARMGEPLVAEVMDINGREMFGHVHRDPHPYAPDTHIQSAATHEHVSYGDDLAPADAEFIAAARNLLPVLLRRLHLAEQALAAIFDTSETQPFTRRRGGNAPGHAHQIAPYWDETGEPCDWCSAWNDARAALAELRRPLDQPDDPT